MLERHMIRKCSAAFARRQPPHRRGAAAGSPGSGRGRLRCCSMDQDEEIVRLRLDISYDGTNFSGWAAQPARRTVEGSLSEALAVLFRRQVPLAVAGRTDAGVHAVGQVAHVDVPADGLRALAPGVRRPHPPAAGLGGRANPDQPADLHRPPAGPGGPPATAPDDAAAPGRRGLLRRLAGLLPPDVRVRLVSEAPPGFDARFSALRRHYRYRLGVAEWGVEPLLRADVFARRRPLDVGAMAAAAGALLGLHDFAAFCKARDGATTIRELQGLTVRQDGGVIVIDVQADAFCHSMVRSLVGSLIAVGEHHIPVDRPAQWLAGAARVPGVHIAPALGLTLMAVDYPPDWALAGRAAATRARRHLPDS